jgi:hypothetical protein
MRPMQQKSDNLKGEPSFCIVSSFRQSNGEGLYFVEFGLVSMTLGF